MDRDEARLRATGLRLRLRRQDRGLDVAAFAQGVGVAAELWTAVEKGDIDLPVHLLWRAAALLGTTMSDVVADLW